MAAQTRYNTVWFRLVESLFNLLNHARICIIGDSPFGQFGLSQFSSFAPYALEAFDG